MTGLVRGRVHFGPADRTDLPECVLLQCCNEHSSASNRLYTCGVGESQDLLAESGSPNSGNSEETTHVEEDQPTESSLLVSAC